MIARPLKVIRRAIAVLLASAASGAVAAGYYPMYASWEQPGGAGSAITLTYSYSNLLDGSIKGPGGIALERDLLRSAFELALADYAAVLPIHFVEVPDRGPLPETGEYDPTGLANIRVGQVPNIDDANAYAYFPFSAVSSGLAGDIVFNANRFGFNWTPTLFYAVAQHELGHSLGMGHFIEGEAQPATFAGALYDGPLIPLASDMIAALQGVYGAGTGSVMSLAAVPEAETWTLIAIGLVLIGFRVRRAQRPRHAVVEASEQPGVDPRRRRESGVPGSGVAPEGWAAARQASRLPGSKAAGIVERRTRAPTRTWRAAVVGAVLMQLASAAAALTIEFDYRYDTRGFFTNALTGAPIVERRAVLELAASYYSGFADALTAIAPGGDNGWSVRFTHPSLEGPAVTLVNESIPADTVRIFVGGSNSAPGVLGFASVGEDRSATGSPDFVEAVIARGQAGAIGATATDYGTWGGMIWFNAAQDWYFGASTAGLTADQPDFLTTATHEIGHILGFGEADSWLARIDEYGRFAGPRSMEIFGAPVPLDRFGSHWAEGTMSFRNGVEQETLMDPSTARGVRELPSELDYAGFADIGWQVSAVPEPASVVLFAIGLMAVLRAARPGKRHSRGTKP